MDTQLVTVSPPPTGDFASLERLSISGRIVNIGAMITHCPRLRVLSAKFRDLGPEYIVPALSSLKSALRSRKVTVSLLDICILRRDVYDFGLRGNIGVPVFILILGIMADLSPEKLVFTNKYHTQGTVGLVNLPCFPRTISIEIDWQGITFTRPWYGQFSALKRLCLLGCNVVNLGELVSCCPRLRVLRMDAATSKQDITVHSATLHELVLGAYTECRGVHVLTPVLKQLTMEVSAGEDLSMFVSAPLVEKVSWRRSYTGSNLVLGFWLLRRLSLETMESYRERLLADGGEDTCLQVQQMPRSHVLSLDICVSDRKSDAHLNFAQETEKLPVTNISVVDIRLDTMGHEYGATLLDLLEAPRVQSATRILQLTLLWSQKFKVTEECMVNCLCDQHKNWRSQSIALKHLEVIEIKGFKGDDPHDFYFVELLLAGAPMLKRFTLKLENVAKSYGYRGCTKKIHKISMKYPSMIFRVYLDSRRLVLS